MNTTLLLFVTIFVVAMATIFATLHFFYIKPKEEMEYQYRQGFINAQNEIFRVIYDNDPIEDCWHFKYSTLLKQLKWTSSYKEFIKNETIA
jgi:hypothetical protein